MTVFKQTYSLYFILMDKKVRGAGTGDEPRMVVGVRSCRSLSVCQGVQLRNEDLSETF